MKNLKLENLNVAIADCGHQEMKAYWFRAAQVVRNQGVTAFISWANKGGAPGPRHRHILRICGFENAAEMFADANFCEIDYRSRVLDAMGAFEKMAKGERTDNCNYPTNNFWCYG